MSALHLVDAVALGRPVDPALLPQDSINPVSGAATPMGSQSPHETIARSTALVADYASAAHDWHPVAAPQNARITEQLHPGSIAYSVGGHLAGEISAMAYPTPDQSLSVKTHTVGNPLDPSYGGSGLMLGSAPVTAHPDNGASGFPVALGAMPPQATTSFSEFASAATTPPGMHNSVNSSPMSLRAGLEIRTTEPSSAHMVTTAALHTLGEIPPVSAGLGPRDAPSGFEGFVNGTAASLSHPMAPNAPAPHGTGMMNAAGGGENPLSSAEGSGFGICEDKSMENIAFWDANSNVCIPAMENLRLQLNLQGMTANHTDSLQKNFNDYQFKRQTDQRRTRHTSEPGIVKFSNPSFLPNREDLLHLVVRKSAMKKLQNNASRERAGGAAPSSSRKKTRYPSARGGNTRASRQSTSERVNPYARYMQGEAGSMSAFQIPISPSTTTFQAQQPPPGTSGMPPLYASSEAPGIAMSMSVPPLGFFPPSVPGSEHAADPVLVSSSTGEHSHAPFYVDNPGPGFVLPNLMHQQQHVSMPMSLQGQYPLSMAPPPSQLQTPQMPPPAQPHQHQQRQHHDFMQLEHSPRTAQLEVSSNQYRELHVQEEMQHLPLHPPQQQQPHHYPYQIFSHPGDMPSHPTPPHGVGGEGHPA
ncbi:hypothetical protein GGF46_000598 [Coemansia sp. RSA 552]|nr:hypothetical protein GGF46_000598 [Coemansia sp. RSA 552]